jgi:glycosyltransferase involved in cell wall biosynthesis
MSKVSIFVTVYNEIRFIRRTLESIISEADEILISDYGSTDGTLEVLEEFSAKYPQVMYQVHNGLSSADRWNWLFHNAHGKYVRLIGGHDMVSSGSSKSMVALLENNPDAVMAYSKYCIELNSDYSFYNFLHMNEDWINGFSLDSPFDRVRLFMYDYLHCYIFYGLYRKDLLMAAQKPSVFIGPSTDIGVLTFMASKGKLLADDFSIFFWMNPRPRLDFASELKRTALTMSDKKTDHPFFWTFLIICEQHDIVKDMETWKLAPAAFSEKLLKTNIQTKHIISDEDSRMYEINSFVLPFFQIRPGKECLCNEVLNAVNTLTREERERNERERERELRRWGYKMKNLFSIVKHSVKKRFREILLNSLKALESTGSIVISQKKIYDEQKKMYDEQKLDIYGTLVFEFSMSMRPGPQTNRIAVFGVLPPEKTGIAFFNAKTFGINNVFNVFSDIKTLKDFAIAKNISGLEYKNNFFSLESYDSFKTQINYSAKIFILGNSKHHTPYLKRAIIEPEKQHSWLYLHDACIVGSICGFLSSDIEAGKEILCKVYPMFTVKISSINDRGSLINFFKENELCGVKVIIYLTGIIKIIVNNDLSRQLVENEVYADVFTRNVEIAKLFLPILNLNDIPRKKICADDNAILIGSFGYPTDKCKAVNIIIEAVDILNKEYGINAKCIIAGYHVDEYCKSISEDLQNLVIAFSDVSEDDLFSLMKSVHIAVQLRNITHGESSGAVSLLLGMNKKLITTENVIDSELEKHCTLVPRFVTKEVLAAAIMKEIQTVNNTDNNALLSKFNFQNLSDKILSLCEYNTGVKT